MRGSAALDNVARQYGLAVPAVTTCRWDDQRGTLIKGIVGPFALRAAGHLDPPRPCPVASRRCLATGWLTVELPIHGNASLGRRTPRQGNSDPANQNNSHRPSSTI